MCFNLLEQQENFLILVNGWVKSSISAFRIEQQGKVVECAHSLVAPNNGLIDATGGIMTIHETKDLAAVVCGGQVMLADSNNVENRKCIILNSNQDQNQLPTASLSLNLARVGAVSLVLDNGKSLWVTGGFNENSYLLNTEFVTFPGDISNNASINGGEVANEHGPSFLKSNLFYHCLVKIGSEMAILIGGEYNADHLPVYPNIFCFPTYLSTFKF